MAVIVDPTKVTRIWDGDTATIDALDNHTAKGRYKHSAGFYLFRLIVNFSGGSGVNDMTLYRQVYETQSQGNYALYTLPQVGVGNPVDFRIGEQEREFYWFAPVDTLVLAWTNPDAPTMSWNACVEIALPQAVVGIR